MEVDSMYFIRQFENVSRNLEELSKTAVREFRRSGNLIAHRVPELNSMMKDVVVGLEQRDIEWSGIEVLDQAYPSEVAFMKLVKAHQGLIADFVSQEENITSKYSLSFYGDISQLDLDFRNYIAGRDITISRSDLEEGFEQKGLDEKFRREFSDLAEAFEKAPERSRQEKLLSILNWLWSNKKEIGPLMGQIIFWLTTVV